MNLIFRQAIKADKKEIKRFYKKQQYSAKFMGLDHCFIAEKDTIIIASVIISKLTDNNQQYFLHALAVDRSYQNQGLASKLLKYATNHIATKEQPTAIVCFCNPDLIPLYQKTGFNLLTQEELKQTLYSRYLLYRNKQSDLVIAAISYD